MNALDALWHILHFTAPAFAVALLALSLGLWFLGNDGKMLSYLAMVLACASSQWCLMRSWRG